MNYDSLLGQLELHEGFRSKVYKDSVGVNTIGIGRNVDSNGITREEALYLLRNDVDRVITEIRSRYEWYDSLSEIRKRVVVDMVFNLGIYRFSKFINTIKYIELGWYSKAAEGMLNSKWATQVGKRAIRLAKMMRTDEVY